MRSCLQCGGEMKIIVNFTSKKAKTSQSKYKVRRAQCTVCDYTELVTGSDGQYEKMIESQAIKAARNPYK